MEYPFFYQARTVVCDCFSFLAYIIFTVIYAADESGKIVDFCPQPFLKRSLKKGVPLVPLFLFAQNFLKQVAIQSHPGTEGIKYYGNVLGTDSKQF